MTDVLFIAKSGADEYGWAKTDSDVDLRLVWVPPWKLAVSMKMREKAKEVQHLRIDYTAYSIHHFLGQLVKGNGNRLENLFQNKIFEDKEAVAELQKMAMENLHLGYLKHWLGYSNGIKKDMKNPARLEKYGMPKLILDAYRVLLAGIILAKEKQVVYHLPSQGRLYLTNFADYVLHEYLLHGSLSPLLEKDAQDEIDTLQAKLQFLIDNSTWPKRIGLSRFDQWLIDYYDRMKR